MSVNPYFSHETNKAEQDFFESLIVENIKAAGMDVKYLPRENQVDSVLREELQSQFNSAYIVEAYFHDVQGFGGQRDLMTKFGFQTDDTMSISIAKKRWRDLKMPNRLEKPVEGDLIYLPVSGTIFEITFVEHEDPFWQLGRYNVFKLDCVMFTQSYNDKFNTSDADFNSDANADNPDEINKAINNAIKTKGDVLLSFDEKNPFGDL